MMPSRGIHIARGKLPRLIHQQSRNISSTPRSLPRSVLLNSNSPLRASNAYTRAIPATIPSIVAIRHASSWSSWLGLSKNDEASAALPGTNTPAATAQQTPPPPPPAESVSAASSPSASTTVSTAPATEPAQFSNLDTITLDNIDLQDPVVDISHIPEGIGYLKEIGIDYGWGPTSILEWTVEHAHIYLGLPWWASIVVTAVCIRTVMFPLYIKMSDTQAREKALSSVLKPFTERMQAAQKSGDTQALTTAWQQTMAIRKKAGIKYRDQFLPLGLQGVIGYCGYKLTHACATLPVPGFTEGGFLWLKDLTLTDGYLLMPLIMAGSMHLVARLGGEAGAAAQVPPQMKTLMLYIMPCFIFLVTAWQPGAVCVWFSSTGALGIIQGQVLKLPAVRSYLGIAPLYTPTQAEQAPGVFDSFLKSRGLGPKPTTDTPTIDPSAGKNTAYMYTMYQSPNLRRNTEAKTIDTTIVTPNPAGTSATPSEMIQPGTPAEKKGMFSSLKDSYKNAREQSQRQVLEEAERRKNEQTNKKGGRGR